MKQTWENSKELISGPILARSDQIWAQKIFFLSFFSASSSKLLQTIILCNLK